MALLRILLTLSITSPILSVIGLKLINNGYENLYIVIEETVPESEELLDRIQEIFTDASVLLYKATHKRAYFRSVKVIIPKTWTKKGSYSTVSALTSTSSHIKVGNSEMKVPHTVGNEECGQSGMYTYLPYKEFFLWYGQTFWGKHGTQCPTQMAVGLDEIMMVVQKFLEKQLYRRRNGCRKDIQTPQNGV